MNRTFSVLLFAYLGMLVLRPWLESEMTTHMGVLIPLLLIWGGYCALLLIYWHPWLVKWAERYRYSLLLFAVFCILLWMLPRLLDASLYVPMLSAYKWISLPLAGMALVLCWRHLPWLLRATLHLEAVATLFRLGWLYMAAPQEYCVSYGINDQQRLGELLLLYAVVYGGGLGLRVMFLNTKS